MRVSGVWRMAAGAAMAAVLGAVAPSASAAVVIGDVDPGGSSSCSGPTAMVQTTPAVGKTYTSPIDGVVTEFTFQGPGLPPPTQTKLLVLEQLSATEYRVVAAGPFESSDVFLTTRPTRVAISAGQVIGSYGSSCYADMPSNGGMFRQAQFVPEPPVGGVQTYGGPSPGRMVLQATIEPDCDRDGFGDETQDNDLSPCPPAPAATITGGPKDRVKTKKKRKNVTFTFNANEPGATFDCTLDGKQEFKACTSPLTVSVKKGSHTFSVTATDAGGNAGAAASDQFKVKRKKKKKK